MIVDNVKVTMDIPIKIIHDGGIQTEIGMAKNIDEILSIKKKIILSICQEYYSMEELKRSDIYRKCYW